MKFAVRFSVFALLAISATLITACGKDHPTFSMLPAGQTFTQTPGSSVNNKLDILFVIDNQPNMSAFQASLVASFATFRDSFQSKGFDYKMAVETSDGYMADPTLAGYSSANVALADWNDCSGTTCSGTFVILPTDTNYASDFTINAKPNKDTAGQDARAFSSMRQGLRNTRPVNSGFVRSDSFLAVIIVDNQDDFSDNTRCAKCSMNLQYNDPNLDPVSTYVNFLDTLTSTTGSSRRYNVSAMTQIAQPCQGGTNMTRIEALANSTNGVLGDICQSDYGNSMVAIANQIATLSTQFYLSRVPVVSTIVVYVNNVQVPQSSTNGWEYNSAGNSIEFFGSAIPAQGEVIAVDFVPATITQ